MRKLNICCIGNISCGNEKATSCNIGTGASKRRGNGAADRGKSSLPSPEKERTTYEAIRTQVGDDLNRFVKHIKKKLVGN